MDGSSFLAAFASAGSADGQKSTLNSKSPNNEEVIHFNGLLDSFPVKGKQVRILPSPGDHEVGSSKLKISNIVDYGWEHKYYPGHLVATHNSGDYFAYGIFAAAKQTGVVRVVYRKTQDRVLLKGMTGRIKDLAFSHCRDKIYLAVVDSAGTLFVFNVWFDSSTTSLQTALVLEIKGSKAPGAQGIHRVIWCPFLPDEDEDVEDEEDDSNSRLLVHINGCVADMWNVDTVLAKHGGALNGPFEADQITEGQLRITDHTEPISDASFSPDGTALATASLDGQVKFFQVYMFGTKESPRCLHHWQPHDGKPVSSLFFLDNHRDYNPDVQFWKFAVTGAEHNSEIKVWSCESWDCIQTIRFDPSPSSAQPSMFKAALDLSARYLLLSNIHQKIVYVLQLQPDKEEVEAKKEDPEKPANVTVVSVSEFSTPTPFISLSISEAGKQQDLLVSRKGRRKRADTEDTNGDTIDSSSDSEGDSADSCDSDDGGQSEPDSTSIKFLLVNPKSLQECKISYRDAHDLSVSKAGQTNGIKREIVEEDEAEKDAESPVSTDTDNVVVRMVPSELMPNIKNEPEDVEADKTLPLELSEAAKKITLMSPEVFVTTGGNKSAAGGKTGVKGHIKTEVKSEPPSAPIDQLDDESVVVIKTEPGASQSAAGIDVKPSKGQLLISSILASGGSSPSREVQNILAEQEEHGGMLNDVVITEETDDDDDEEVEVVRMVEDEDYNEDAEFEGLDEKLAAAAWNKNSNAAAASGGQSQNASELLIKKEIKQEVLEEDGDGDDEMGLDPLSNLIKNHLNISAASNKSSQEVASQQNQAWQNLVAKQEASSPQSSVATAAAGSRSFNIKQEPTESVQVMNASAGPVMFAPPSASAMGATSSPVVLAAAAAPAVTADAVAQINQQLAAMAKTMNEMASVVQKQRSEIKALREEVRNASASTHAEAQAVLARAVKDQTEAVSHKVDASIKREMKKVSGDLSKGTSAAIQHHLRSESAPKCEQALREAVSKMTHSRHLTEGLGMSLAQALTPTLQASFRDIFASVLTPAFERALQNMLNNLGQTFTKGTRDYETVIRKEVHQLTNQVKEAVRNLEKSRGNQSSEIERALSGFQETILQEIRENARAQRSLSATPVSGSGGSGTNGGGAGGSLTPAEAAKETKKEIVATLRAGSFNEAFQMALSARNLELVVMTCEMVNPTQIFSQDNCPLNQSVLLSLIQQLGSKLHDRTEIKLKYLEEAVTHLDTSDASIETSMTKLVLNQLMAQLQDYYTKHPQQKFSKRMKYLFMATGFTLQQKGTPASPPGPVTDLTF